MFPTTQENKHSITTPYTSNPHDFKCEQNVNAIVRSLQEAGVLPMVESNRGLVNTFIQKEANTVQQHDLMNYRTTNTYKEYQQ